MRRHFLACAALVAASSAHASAAVPPPAPAGPTVIPLRALRGHVRTVRVAIGGDSLDFPFDTGNGTMLITPEPARKVGCEPTGRMVGFRMTGEKVGGPYCDDVSMRVGDVPVHGPVGVANMAKVMGGPTELAGVIGLTAFAGRTITLDLAGNRLILETPSSAAERTRAMRPVPARLATGEGAATCASSWAFPSRGRHCGWSGTPAATPPPSSRRTPRSSSASPTA